MYIAEVYHPDLVVEAAPRPSAGTFDVRAV